MNELRYTLLADGPGDRALIPILTWLLQEYLPSWAIQAQWADLWRLPNLPNVLHQKIKLTIDFYQCDLLFIHRDAERVALADRLAEVADAVEEARKFTTLPPCVGVVPVRMTEAWLLFNTDAIKEAAGNPNGTAHLSLPGLRRLEEVPDPKAMLHNLILEATELGSHRRKHFKVKRAVQRIPECIEDFSPLRELPAFSNLEEELRETIACQRWGD
ncbi:MAG TPA: hypothetical protein VMW24_00325 [Sedimentisphaerales bacterium]|nr:hypothetical protein [Sedimentisphaerales bacterium]